MRKIITYSFVNLTKCNFIHDNTKDVEQVDIWGANPISIVPPSQKNTKQHYLLL